jgi:allophanate hydrolase subunit 1
VRDVRDGVVLADVPEASEDEANRWCVAAAERLRVSRLRGLRDAIPSARSLLVDFDPALLGGDRVTEELESWRGGG